MRLGLALATSFATVVLAVGCQQQLAVTTPVNSPEQGTVSNNDPAPTTAATNVPRPDPAIVQFDTTARPPWLATKIQELSSQKKANPPITIFRYRYRNQTVYFQTAPGRDQPSTLYDSKGKILCQPDGGLTGKGDSNCLDFQKKRTEEMLVWQDQR